MIENIENNSVADNGEDEKAAIEIEKSVKKTISMQLGVRLDDVKTGSRLCEDLGADSLDMVEVVMALEEDFDIQITNEAVEYIKTVRQMIDYVILSLVEQQAV